MLVPVLVVIVVVAVIAYNSLPPRRRDMHPIDEREARENARPLSEVSRVVERNDPSS
jgi:hypothetical protein